MRKRTWKGPARKPAMSAEESISRYLEANRKGRNKRFTTTIAGIYELGGAEGVIQWAYKRIENSIGSPAELIQLQTVVNSAAKAEARRDRQLDREFEEARQRHDYVQMWRGLLKDRDLQERARARREFDPRRSVQERLERMKQQTTNPAGAIK